MTAQEVTMSLYGLQNMVCDAKEVLDLVQVLLPLAELCIESFDSQSIDGSLYGLQNMKSNSPHIRKLFENNLYQNNLIFIHN